MHDPVTALNGAIAMAGTTEPPIRKRRSAWRRLLDNPVAVAALIGLVIITLLAVIAPLLPIPAPEAMRPRERLAPPGQMGYLLGSDELGRDLLSRMIWGGRVSLKVGFVASTLALLGGVSLGVVSGFYGGRLDDVLMRFTDVVMAFPVILLAIGIIAALGPGLSNAMLAAAISGFPLYTRVARASVLSARETDYVLAARALGAGSVRIMLLHLLPNIFAPLLVTFTLDVGNMIILTSSLSFLGLGTQPPTPDWGNIVSTGRAFIRNAPHLITVPGIAIFAVVLALNVLGDGLRDVLDPRLRN